MRFTKEAQSFHHYSKEGKIFDYAKNPNYKYWDSLC